MKNSSGNLLNTGGGNSKLKNVGVRTGVGSKGSSPASASQLGTATAFRKEQVDSERGYSGGGKFGNELATNVQGGGPGRGRVLYGQSGVQGLHGQPAGTPRPPSRDFLSSFGPEKSKG